MEEMQGHQCKYLAQMELVTSVSCNYFVILQRLIGMNKENQFVIKWENHVRIKYNYF